MAKLNDHSGRRAVLRAAATLSMLNMMPRAGWARLRDTAPEDYAKMFVNAEKRGVRIPPASTFEPDMSEDRAYRFQVAVAHALGKGRSIAGIKGGGMTEASKARLGGGPFFGVLPILGRRSSGTSFDLGQFRELAVEIEIGFELGRPVSSPLPSVEVLRDHIAAVRPVVELPDNALEKSARLTATDLIAANVLARCFIAGRRSLPSGPDLDALEIRLSRDNAVIRAVTGGGTFGSQWDALLWIVNNAAKRRGGLAERCLIITGSLGGALPAIPGAYHLDYGPLGELAFELREPRSL